ncbi:MAG: Rieske 2Fe-2S domain-containing protein [Acidobacteriota bacterium]
MRSEAYPWDIFPTGWFAVAHSSDVPPGRVLARRFFERDLVLFRTDGGQAGVLDAYCPHMGAHLCNGRVEGEALRCAMHGFRFDAAGGCASTPYSTQVPHSLHAGAYQLRETNGAILVWYDAAGRPPSWDVPPVAMDGFAPGRPVTVSFRGHPQETTENSVDLGHLSEVHGYQNVEIRRELAVEGPHLTIAYAMTRRSPFRHGTTVRAEFDIEVHGLGVSFVDVRVLEVGLHTRHFILVTPVERDRAQMRTITHVDSAVSPRRVHFALGLLPRRLALSLVSRATVSVFHGDIAQDVRIWKDKHYVDPPGLVPGDGPVARYRSWARQFYADGKRPPGTHESVPRA